MRPSKSIPQHQQTPHSCLLQHVNSLTPAHREAGLPPVWDLVYQAGLQLACTAGCEELMGSVAASCQHYAQVRAPWLSIGLVVWAAANSVAYMRSV